MKKIILALLISIPLSLHAQQGVVATGGDATGSGGTMSSSTGLTDFYEIQSEQFSLQFGLQHPYKYVEIYQLTLNLDMSLTPDFDPETDLVYVTGTFIDFWPIPSSDPDNQLMTRLGETMIWTKTFYLEEEKYEYKYFINAGWDGGEWEAGENRQLTLANDMEVNDFWGYPEYPDVIDVTTLAGLRAMPAGDINYRYTGEAVIVAMDDFHNRKFIQDETAAILINDHPGNITTLYELYDVITNVTGQIEIINNMVRFLPTENSPDALENTPVEPCLLALDDVTPNDQAKLIKFHNVTFSGDGSKGVFENGQNYTITDGTNTFVLRTMFWDVDYIDQKIPTDAANITGVVSQFHDQMQITPRFGADIEEYSEPITHYNLYLEVNSPGAGSVTGAGEHEAGTLVSISATANHGYEFVTWTGDTEHVDDASSAHTTVTMPASDISLTAGFVEAGIPENLLLSNETLSDGDTECFDALQTITLSDFTVQAGGSATFIAGQSIHLLPGTAVMHGGYLHARIAANENDFCGMPKAAEIAEEPCNIKEAVLAVDLPVKVNDSDFFKVYPNPTTGEITLELYEFELLSTGMAEIYSMQGQLITRKELPAQKEHILSLAHQKPGIYLLRISYNNKTGSVKIIKQ